MSDSAPPDSSWSGSDFQQPPRTDGGVALCGACRRTGACRLGLTTEQLDEAGHARFEIVCAVRQRGRARRRPRRLDRRRPRRGARSRSDPPRSDGRDRNAHRAVREARAARTPARGTVVDRACRRLEVVRGRRARAGVVRRGAGDRRRSVGRPRPQLPLRQASSGGSPSRAARQARKGDHGRRRLLRPPQPSRVARRLVAPLRLHARDVRGGRVARRALGLAERAPPLRRRLPAAATHLRRRRRGTHVAGRGSARRS